jgi:hypothetical protein
MVSSIIGGRIEQRKGLEKAVYRVIARSVSDEAIQFCAKILDCFASLAMTTTTKV